MSHSENKYSQIFLENDDDKFISICQGYLEKEAHTIRNLSAAEYVKICRDMWNECELDEVFTFKIIIDKNIYSGNEEEYKKMGLERHDLEPSIKEDLYCIACGIMNEDGTYVGAPEGYDPKPKNPNSKRGVAIARPSPFKTEEPDEPIAQDYIVAFFDILGFENTFVEIGIQEIHNRYQSLISVALKPFAEKNLWSKFLEPFGSKTYVPGMYWFPIRYAYFSDSLLLWIQKDESLFLEFLGRCAKVFCTALHLGIPLRGAISIGKQVLHNKSNTYIGAPLIEAARLESAQNWIGLALGKSFTDENNTLPIPPAFVRIFDVPVKSGKQHLLSGLVLDWSRSWKKMFHESPKAYIEKMKKEGFEKYYDNALHFYEKAIQDMDWFMNIPMDNIKKK